MKAIRFLTQLAHTTHFDENLNKVVLAQPKKLKNAFRKKNSLALKKYISEKECFAHETHVIQSLIYDFNQLIEYDK